MKHYSAILRSPLITEKGTLVNEQANQVLFRVSRDANKVEIQRRSSSSSTSRWSRFGR